MIDKDSVDLSKYFYDIVSNQVLENVSTFGDDTSSRDMPVILYRSDILTRQTSLFKLSKVSDQQLFTVHIYHSSITDARNLYYKLIKAFDALGLTFMDKREQENQEYNTVSYITCRLLLRYNYSTDMVESIVY